jgi:hypothetical protein
LGLFEAEWATIGQQPVDMNVPFERMSVGIDDRSNPKMDWHREKLIHPECI